MCLFFFAGLFTVGLLRAPAEIVAVPPTQTIQPESPVAGRAPASLLPTVPVYHVRVDALESGTTNRVRSGRNTFARFWIGLPDATANTEIGKWTVNPELARATGRVPLTVTMTCSFCRTKSRQAALTYDGSSGTSDQAAFALDPDRTLTGADGAGRLDFHVFSAGSLLDTFAADMIVDPPSAEKGGVRAGALTLLSEPAPAAAAASTPDPALVADITLTFVNDHGLGLTVTLESADAQAAFDRRPEFGGRAQATMSTGTTAALVKASTTQALKVIKDLVRDYGPAHLDNVALGDTPWTPKAGVKKDVSARDAVLAKFAEQGQALYYALFTHDPTLAQFMSALEDAPPPTKRGWRIVIEPHDLVVCPWAILRRDTDATVDQFWGFKHELSVMLYPHPGRVAAPKPGAGKTAFIGAPHEATDHSVGWFATQSLTYLQTQAGAGVQSIRLRQQLNDRLLSDHAFYRIIYAYLHGSDGVASLPTSEGPAVVATLAGPHLTFKPQVTSESFGPSDFELIRAKLKLQNVLFEQFPIVVLNACETDGSGTAAVEGAPYLLPGAFLLQGASGVVATVAPVDSYLAFRFGSFLLASLVKNVPLPQALVEARRGVLENDYDPFGLLYAFYGPANSRLGP